MNRMLKHHSTLIPNGFTPRVSRSPSYPWTGVNDPDEAGRAASRIGFPDSQLFDQDGSQEERAVAKGGERTDAEDVVIGGAGEAEPGSPAEPTTAVAAPRA